METKSSRKESSFLDEMPLIKLVGAANGQSPAIPRQFVALYHRRTKIKVRSVGVSKCCGNHCWLGIVLQCGYC